MLDHALLLSQESDQNAPVSNVAPTATSLACFGRRRVARGDCVVAEIITGQASVTSAFRAAPKMFAAGVATEVVSPVPSGLNRFSEMIAAFGRE